MSRRNSRRRQQAMNAKRRAAGPVFRRMDGSAIGPVEVDAMAFANGGHMVRWEVVEVRPGEPEVVATLIPEAEWRA